MRKLGPQEEGRRRRAGPKMSRRWLWCAMGAAIILVSQPSNAVQASHGSVMKTATTSDSAFAGSSVVRTDPDGQSQAVPVVVRSGSVSGGFPKPAEGTVVPDPAPTVLRGGTSNMGRPMAPKSAAAAQGQAQGLRRLQSAAVRCRQRCRSHRWVPVLLRRASGRPC